jgi:hypothetical protein
MIAVGSLFEESNQSMIAIMVVASYSNSRISSIESGRTQVLAGISARLHPLLVF